MSGWATRTSILMVDASEYSSHFQSQSRVSNSAETEALCKDLGQSTRKFWTLRLNLCFVEKAKAYHVEKRVDVEQTTMPIGHKLALIRQICNDHLSL